MNRLLLLGLLCGLAVVLVKSANPHDAFVEDNDFAEFEEFDEEEVTEEAVKQPDASQPQREAEAEPADAGFEDEEEEDGIIESEDDEFEHLQDEEEFENFDKEKGSSPKTKGGEKLPDLQMAKVPLHLRTNWDSFYLEMLMIAGLGVYFLNFLAGKTKNSRLATAWLSAHKDLLEANFAIVGDDGTGKEPNQGVLMKESENIYALWCSGRSCVEGMLVELKLLKRQDLVNVLLRVLKPAADQIVVNVTMEDKKMDKFVFAVALKKAAARLHKDMYDLGQFTEKKNVDKYDLPPSYQILSETGEATLAILDKKVCQVLTKFDGLIEYIHLSDQFSGPKSTEDTQPTKLPTVKPCLIFCFTVPGKGKSRPADMESMRPLLQLVFYITEKVSRFQLSREARLKGEKRRQKVEEQFMKAAHSQRQEAAQLRREEKIRADKERLMAEEDPDKARKLEERENRREMKRKQPKMKMMKIN
ncbi:PAT complex subunit CCDC47-like isoform X2 [Littorina saxatilis]|uniref:PAT complex subunit CCDC47 n=1 Tax=Littorina saxatilis TaxID=31220 RepID=A0AAN9BRD3_9CAEN